MREGYIPKDKRKKILLLSDDLRLHSGIATMSREIVYQTCHRFNWAQLGAAVQHPDKQIIDVSQDLSKNTGVVDASALIYPTSGYGDANILRWLIQRENPDALMFFTDPRYWGWLFAIEGELRKKLPMIYLNIWDDLPAPLYNKPFYESCDALFGISKQTVNINRMVLGDKAKDKVIKYVPHGINPELFTPVDSFSKDELKKLQEFKKELLKGKEYDFIVLYNSRNIRRKSPSDLIAGYKLFCDTIGKEKAKKCLLLMHTDPVDEHGTNLYDVRELFCDPEYVNVEFTQAKYPPPQMKYLYNLVDVTCLPSSNEGWGLSLTESLMCGKMIIGNVTGGIQDQMRFVDRTTGKWIDFDENFCSNHFGTHKDCGEWAIPVFPSNSSVIGSIPTPYIWDDRADFRDIAKAIQQVYEMSAEERTKRGMAGREWVTSKESMMSGPEMGQNVIDGIEETLKVWKPKKNHEFIKVQPAPRKQLVHKLIY